MYKKFCISLQTLDEIREVNPLFITFEGIDFSGKTTQALKLVDRLKNKGYEVVYIREPGGTEISEAIRNILLDNRYSEMHARTELFLYSAARAQIVEQVIRPALLENKIVICDRYADSTTAYQGHGRGLDLKMISSLNQFATGQLKPQLTFLLDVPPEVANKRHQKGGLRKDRLENEQKAFYDRVRKGYLKMAQQEPHRYQVIDGTSSVDIIQQNIWQKVNSFISTTFKALEDA